MGLLLRRLLGRVKVGGSGIVRLVAVGEEVSSSVKWASSSSAAGALPLRDDWPFLPLAPRLGFRRSADLLLPARLGCTSSLSLNSGMGVSAALASSGSSTVSEADDVFRRVRRETSSLDCDSSLDLDAFAAEGFCATLAVDPGVEL